MKILLFVLLSSLCFGQNCDSVLKKFDKLSGNLYHTAIVTNSMLKMGDAGVVSFIILSKATSPNDTSYVVSIGLIAKSAPDPELRQGVVLLFSDGTKFDKPQQPVKISSNGGIVQVRSELLLDAAEFSELTKRTLVDVRIALRDGTVTPKLAKSVNSLGDCILTSW